MKIIKKFYYDDKIVRETRNEKLFILDGFRVWAKSHKDALIKLNQYVDAFGHTLIIKKETE